MTVVDRLAEYVSTLVVMNVFTSKYFSIPAVYRRLSTQYVYNGNAVLSVTIVVNLLLRLLRFLPLQRMFLSNILYHDSLTKRLGVVPGRLSQLDRNHPLKLIHL